ncbi:MAG: sensor domain-containing diguanylate cyclase [Ferrimicrobium sp.]
MATKFTELSAARSHWSPPRLTSKVFIDLALWMIGFGLLVGIVFPPAVIALGVPPATALSPLFYTGTIGAGIIVGLANFTIAHRVVGSRMRELSSRMVYVGESLQEATQSGDPSNCSPEHCQIVVDSNDEIGDAARAFNGLLDSLTKAQKLEHAVASVTRSFTEHLGFDELMDTVLDQYLHESGASAGAVLVARDGLLSVGSSRNISRAGLEDTSLLNQALRTRSITSVKIPDDLVIEAMAVSFRPREVLVIPAWLSGQALGAIVLAFAEPVTTDILHLLTTFQASTSVAINNALTHERFQRLAALDPLTDAYNRRFGLNRLAEEFGRTLRTSVPLGLLTFDIDHFKQVNDTHGHLAGDRVLRVVANAVRLALRDGDVLIRTGGEEFVVLLPGAGFNDVEAVGEALRRAIELTSTDVGTADISVTISLGGLAYYGSDATGPEELLAKVDEVMYLSKQSGRNRLTMVRSRDPIRA